MTSTSPKNRHLLMTMTNEPFQPVRLYYSIPADTQLIAKFRGLKCMAEVPEEHCWQWLFEAECASLKFSEGEYARGYLDIPEERRPIIIARIRFPTRDSMTLETNSVPRAITAAQFFAPILGPTAIAIRVRIVNRFFAAEEGTLAELMKTLDHNVTVVDPRQGEETFKRDFEGVWGIEAFNAAADKSMQRKLESKEDVPPVEDFPLAPEEETPNFHHLGITLNLRCERAVEHWRGNTHLTLPAIILRMVKDGRLKM